LTNSKSYDTINIPKVKEIIIMNNFLFENVETGERFFVQCDNEMECEEILLANEIDPDEVIMLDVYDDHEAEILGYDTY